MTPKNQARPEDADDGHQEDKHFPGCKRQAATDPDGKRHLKATKIQDSTAADFVHDATNDMLANALPKYDNPDGTNVTVPLPQGTGFVVKFDPSTAQGQMLVQIVANTLANKLSHTNEVVATMLPRIDETRATFQRSDVVALTQDKIKLEIEKGNAEMGHPSSLESVGQSEGDRDHMAADTEHETSGAAPLAESEDGSHP